MESILDKIKKYLGPEQPYSSILWFLGKTIVYFFVINYFFVVYTGITVPGGKFYFPALFEYADVIGVFRRFLLWGGAQFASLIGYPSGYSDFTMYVHGQSGVRMVYSCMGFGLIAAFSALILAWPARLVNKLTSLVLGIVLIILLNMIRIGGLAVLFSKGYYEHFDFINHHDLFNIVVVVLIFLFFMWHVRRTGGSGQ
jgi:exosortase/archaeosortase family protein